MKKILITLLKLSFISLTCYLIFEYTDTEQAISLLKKISPLMFGAVVSVCFLDKVLMGAKWNILLKVFDVYVPYTVPVIANLRAKVFQFFTPTSLTEDIYKVYYLKQTGAQVLKTVSSIFIERFLGAMSSLAIISLLLYFSTKKLNLKLPEIPKIPELSELPKLPDQVIIIGLGFLAFFVLCVFIYILMRMASKTKARFKTRFIPGKVKTKLNEFIDILSHIKGRERKVWLYFLISIFEKVFYGSAVYFAARSLGLMQIEFLYIISAMPLLALLERLPVSIAAIGVREGLIVVLLSPYHLDPAIAIAVALVVRLGEMAMVLLCLFLWLGKHDPDNYKEGLVSISEEVNVLHETGQV